MSWDINKLIITGNVTADSELKYTTSGTAVLNFSIAVNGKPDSTGKSKTSFFKVTMWGKAAENLQQYILKGKPLIVEGHLEQNNWTDDSGKKRYETKIISDRVKFLGSTHKENQGKPAAQETPQDSFYDGTGFDPTPVDGLFDENSENEPNF